MARPARVRSPRREADPLPRLGRSEHPALVDARLLRGFLTPLIAWVQRGIAPGTVQANTLSLTTFKITPRQKVRPDNALAPVRSAPGSLNGHYHYLGTYH